MQRCYPQKAFPDSPHSRPAQPLGKLCAPPWCSRGSLCLGGSSTQPPCNKITGLSVSSREYELPEDRCYILLTMRPPDTVRPGTQSSKKPFQKGGADWQSRSRMEEAGFKLEIDRMKEGCSLNVTSSGKPSLNTLPPPNQASVSYASSPHTSSSSLALIRL